MSSGLRFGAEVWSSSIVSATSFLAPLKSLGGGGRLPAAGDRDGEQEGASGGGGRIGARG